MEFKHGHLIRLPDGREGSIVKILSDISVKMMIKGEGLVIVDPTGSENIGWIMPEWMEEYRYLLKRFTGGDEVECVMNDHISTIDINAPRAMICVSVKSVVSMLGYLHKDGMLNVIENK